MIMPETTPPCPQCHSSAQVVPIMYGLATSPAFEAAGRGEIVLGGCGIHRFSPKWRCKACHEAFGLYLPERGTAEETAS
jgi:hypothetical protein